MNVLVYVLDSLRPDHLSCYGHERPTSPAIDCLTDDGIMFTNAFAQGIWTAPTSGSLVTGLYPSVHGGETVSEALSPEAPRLAAALSDGGFQTGAVSSIDQVSDFRGFDVGFDEFVPMYESVDPNDLDLVDCLHSELEDWIGTRNENWFAFAWSLGTHTPYLFPDDVEPPFADPAYEGEVNGTIPELKNAGRDEIERIHTLYDSAIRYNDQRLGDLIEMLKDRGEYEETLIVVTGDHGEVFDEHARLEQTSTFVERLFSLPGLRSLTRTFELFDQSAFVGHSALLPYDELLRVPLVVKLPGNRHAGQTVDALVESIDVFPTIVDVADAEGHSVPDLTTLPVQGQSLLDVIDGTESGREYVYSESRTLKGSNRYQSVRTREHKYVEVSWSRPTIEDLQLQAHRSAYSLLEYAVNDTRLLFSVNDLGEPTNELNNHLRDRPGVAADLRERLNDWLAVNEAIDLQNERVTLASDTRNRLDQLGYID